jgi:hypothetical protein
LFQLVKGPSGVFDDSAIDEFDLAGCGQQCDEAWNGVHDQARIALAFAPCFIGYSELACALPDGFLESVGHPKQPVQRGGNSSGQFAACP